jgi:hypothetical protein
MCPLFTYEDLFTVGIGFDIAGAYLLGRALLISPSHILRRSASYFGSNPVDVVGAVRDKVDAVAGLAALISGFVIQVAGYAVILSDDHHLTTGVPRAVTAVALAVGAAAVALVAWRLVRASAVRRLIVDVARTDPTTGARGDKPWGAQLLGFGQELGFDRLNDDESQSDYARRVFGVWDVRPGGPPEGDVIG